MLVLIGIDRHSLQWRCACMWLPGVVLHWGRGQFPPNLGLARLAGPQIFWLQAYSSYAAYAVLKTAERNDTKSVM